MQFTDPTTRLRHKLLPVLGTKKALIVRRTVAYLLPARLQTQTSHDKQKNLLHKVVCRFSFLSLDFTVIHAAFSCASPKAPPFITFITFPHSKTHFSSLTADDSERTARGWKIINLHVCRSVPSLRNLMGSVVKGLLCSRISRRLRLRN